MFEEQELHSVIIAEDMQPARELLVDYIMSRNDLKLSGMAKTGREALSMLNKNRYDLLFLDINFPDISGIEVIEHAKHCPPVIFTTSYDKYAIKAFEVGAVDFLLKPFGEERFNSAVDRAIAKICNKSNKIPVIQNFALTFKEKNVNYIVAYEDIIYLTSRDRGTEIQTTERRFTTSSRLSDIEIKLPDNVFSRISRNCIVNTKYIIKTEYMIGGSHLLYIDNGKGATLHLSRTYAPAMKEKLGLA